MEDADDELFQRWAQEVQESHNDLISFINHLPYYYETEDYIFVHAGINPAHEDWKNTSQQDFIWIRNPFLDFAHPFPQTIIHGHTPTIHLHQKADIYFGTKKVGIDGGCVYGHQLNCLEIKDGKFATYFVKASSIK